MTYANCIELAANWASILTAAVAVLAYGLFLCERRAKRVRLERHLKSEKEKGDDLGQRTLVHLVRHLGMSESDIMDCAFRSKHVDRKAKVEDGKAIAILLEYKP